MSKRMHIWRKIWKLGIGIAILSILLYNVGVENVGRAFLSVRVLYLPPIVFLLVLVTLFNPLTLVSLYYPLKTKKMPVGLFFKLRLIAQILGNITPNKIGELYLLVVLRKRYRIRIAPIFNIFVLDKLISVLHFLFFGLLGFIFLFGNTQMSFLLAGILGGVIIGIISVFYGFRRIQKLSFRWLRFGRINTIREIMEFFPIYLKRYSSYILLSAVLTFLAFLLTTVLGIFILYSLGVKVSFWVYFLIINLISVAALIPLHFTGFGIKEVTSVYLLTHVGVNIVAATSAVILFVVLRYFVYMIVFLIIKVKEKEIT